MARAAVLLALPSSPDAWLSSSQPPRQGRLPRAPSAPDSASQGTEPNSALRLVPAGPALAWVDSVPSMVIATSEDSLAALALLVAPA
jgi:hypothetical protein